MTRAGIVFLWTYRKEALSLLYLFLVGMAFGTIWIFHNSNSGADISKKNLAFEENHENVGVLIAQSAIPAATRVIPPLPDKITGNVPYGDLWKRNAVMLADIDDQKPQIAIVIDDLGITGDRTRQIINLPAPLTLSFLPYAPDLPFITRLAKNRGHELMLHLPMEPKGKSNPGPHALFTAETAREILAELDYSLSRFEGFVGINNHMGSAFTEDSRGLDLILNEIQNRGLLVLDSRTSANSLLAPMAARRHIPNASRDFFLDNRQDVNYILGQLAKTEMRAARNGYAIAIGHPYGETIQALALWLPEARSRGIEIVPLSHIIRRKYEMIYLAGEGGQAISAK